MGSKTGVWLSALAIGLFQVVGSFGAANNQSDRRAIDVVALVLVLVGPAALAVRDRWPLAAVAVTAGAADVYIALGYPYGPIFVSVAVALFSAIQAGRRRSTWALSVLAYAGLQAAYFLDPRSTGSSPQHMALVAGWLLVVLAVSDVVRIRRDQRAGQQRAAHDEGLRRMAEERLRLAQDVHDVLAHNISLINVQASVALHLIDEDPGQARSALTNIKQASRDALHELRAALDVLRHGDTAPRAPAPRLSDLAPLLDGVRASGLDVRLEQDGPASPLSPAVELAAYRIIQEALTNVTRHARADTVTVRLTYDDGVTVEVTDDGIGGVAGPGNGIAGMRERATALGGTAAAGPRPDGGFRVTAHLPGREP